MNICVSCFNDIELQQYIKSNARKTGKCTYCSDIQEKEVLEVSELLDFFKDFFGIFVINPAGKPLVELIQEDWNFFSNETQFEILLSEILTLTNLPINTPREPVTYIDEITDVMKNWGLLKEKIKWQRRFVTNIDEVFDYDKWLVIFDSRAEFNSNNYLYRARIHQESGISYNENQMGRPPKQLSSAGRANPKGIPYLYLCEDSTTTLYEVRAVYLDEVSVGAFKVKDGETISLVDFTEHPESIYQMTTEGNIINHAQHILIKNIISSDLSKPLRRYDSELEYLPTQLICEYIRHSSNEIDGIRFQSSLQQGGRNVVLFEDNKVECVSIAKVTVKKIIIDAEEPTTIMK